MQAPIHLMTVEEYMTSNIPGRTELIEGIVYDVCPQLEPHAYAVSKLNKILARALPDDYIVRPQLPLAVDGWTGKNCPEPDIAVVHDRLYTKEHPNAANCKAVIEVSDSTLADDLVKVEIYRRAGLPTWLVDIQGRCVIDYGSTADALSSTYREGEHFEVMGIAVAVSHLLLPAPASL